MASERACRRLGRKRLSRPGFLGLKGSKTSWSGLFTFRLLCSSVCAAFSRLLARLPHILSLSTPSLLSRALTEGHCCPDDSAPAPRGERARGSKGPREAECLEASPPVSRRLLPSWGVPRLFLASLT